MKTLILALAATLALPAAAAAYCAAPSSSGSFTQACEQGVRVIRNRPMPLPRIDPATSAQLELQRDRLALDRRRESNRATLESRKLDLKERDQSLTSYLYRDANSPLRGRGLGGGFGYGAGLTPGPLVFGPRVAPRKRLRH